jgi:hypothetical protein
MKLLVLIIIIALAYSSCSKFDKTEQRPAFIKIEKIDLVINNSSEGSNSSKIVDAWVFVDDELIGIFDLPTTVPITKVGSRTIKVYPGIKKNGIAVDRERYPFYTFYTYNENLIADSTYAIQPTVNYIENAYIWQEDFEDPSFKLTQYQSDTTMNRATTPTIELFEGGAGLISLNSNQYQCEMRTNEANFNNFPTNLSTPGFIELDYSSNFPLEIGILANYVAGETYERSPLITLNATNGVWNKTYLYIPDASNFYSGAPEFDVYFRVTNPNGISGIKVFVDNIKVVFYN